MMGIFLGVMRKDDGASNRIVFLSQSLQPLQAPIMLTMKQLIESVRRLYRVLSSRRDDGEQHGLAIHVNDVRIAIIDRIMPRPEQRSQCRFSSLQWLHFKMEQHGAIVTTFRVATIGFT
jgi:hypothetical protein